MIKWRVRLSDSPVMQYGMGPWFGEVGASAWHSTLSVTVSENPVALAVECHLDWCFAVVMTMGWMTALVQIIRLVRWSRAGRCTPPLSPRAKAGNDGLLQVRIGPLAANPW